VSSSSLPTASSCAAKVYKQTHQRNFRQRQDYVEGRNTGDSREQRAMQRGSRFGKQASEEAWQGAEMARDAHACTPPACASRGRAPCATASC
jgi:hypothetical protein